MSDCNATCWEVEEDCANLKDCNDYQLEGNMGDQNAVNENDANSALTCSLDLFETFQFNYESNFDINKEFANLQIKGELDTPLKKEDEENAKPSCSFHKTPKRNSIKRSKTTASLGSRKKQKVVKSLFNEPKNKWSEQTLGLNYENQTDFVSCQTTALSSAEHVMRSLLSFLKDRVDDGQTSIGTKLSIENFVIDKKTRIKQMSVLYQISSHYKDGYKKKL